MFFKVKLIARNPQEQDYKQKLQGFRLFSCGVWDLRLGANMFRDPKP